MGPGFMYKDQELKNEYDISKGQDLWKKDKTNVKPPPSSSSSGGNAAVGAKRSYRDREGGSDDGLDKKAKKELKKEMKEQKEKEKSEKKAAKEIKKESKKDKDKDKKESKKDKKEKKEPAGAFDMKAVIAARRAAEIQKQIEQAEAGTTVRKAIDPSLYEAPGAGWKG